MAALHYYIAAAAERERQTGGRCGFRRGGRWKVRFALAIAMALAAPISAHANDAARLMAAAIAEASTIPEPAGRALTVIEIAHIQATAGLKNHAREALRQTADGIWRLDARDRSKLLAAVVEAQCALDFREDARQVMGVAISGATAPEESAPLLRAALYCRNDAAATSLEQSLQSPTAGSETRARAAVALAKAGLPARAAATWRRLPGAERAAASAAVATHLARFGHRAPAREISPAHAVATAETAIPVLLKEAASRRRIGERDAALAFLGLARQRIPEAPRFAPKLAAAYADADAVDAALAIIPTAKDDPAASAALAAAYARAGDLEAARAWAARAPGASGARALAAIARAARDPDAAAAAADRAEAAPPGPGRAMALAEAAGAAFSSARQ